MRGMPVRYSTVWLMEMPFSVNQRRELSKSATTHETISMASLALANDVAKIVAGFGEAVGPFRHIGIYRRYCDSEQITLGIQVRADTKGNICVRSGSSPAEHWFPILSRNGLRTYVALCTPAFGEVVVVMRSGQGSFLMHPVFSDGERFVGALPDAVALQVPVASEIEYIRQKGVSRHNVCVSSAADVAWALLH